MLEDLVARGLTTTGSRLFVMDGSKAQRAAEARAAICADYTFNEVETAKRLLKNLARTLAPAAAGHAPWPAAPVSLNPRERTFLNGGEW
jgi:hypothetical protein